MTRLNLSFFLRDRWRVLIYTGFVIAGLLVIAGCLIIAPWLALIVAGVLVGVATFFLMEESDYEAD